MRNVKIASMDVYDIFRVQSLGMIYIYHVYSKINTNLIAILYTVPFHMSVCYQSTILINRVKPV